MSPQGGMDCTPKLRHAGRRLIVNNPTIHAPPIRTTPAWFLNQLSRALPAESFLQPVQSFLKFDIFGSFLGLVAQRGWTKGFLIEKPTLKSGTEANSGT